MTTGRNEAFGHAGPVTDLEKDLVLACSTSDIPSISKILESSQEVNFECVDLLNRTPLQLAVENEDIEVTKLLMQKCGRKNIEDCLLFAISLGSENLAMAMLTHPSYLNIAHQDRETDGLSSFNTLPSNSKFPTNTTPLVLASTMNMYEIVRHLLLEGNRIEQPHPLACTCGPCNGKSRRDYFRFAHERLNAYKGLASESYLSLSSEDPVLDAFGLRQTMLKLAETEEHFKVDYNDLADKLSAFSVKLLNKVMSDGELDVILNKVGGKEEDRYTPLGRLRLAVTNQEKKFVAHPSSQMRMKKMWYEGFPALSRGSFIKRIAIVMVYLLCYPVLAITYICDPKYKRIQFMRAPCAKFIAHVYFYLLLLGQLLWIRLAASPYTIEDRIAWGTVNKEIATSYFRFQDQNSILIRSDKGTFVYYLVFAWIIGLLWKIVKSVARDGLKGHFSFLLNWLDSIMLAIYLVSYGFRFYAMYKVLEARNYFIQYQVYENYTLVSPVDLLIAGSSTAVGHYYWLNPDRFSWNAYDPIIVSEGLFAIANVLDFARFVSILPAFEALGTLQISFGIMVKEIVRFLGLFGLVYAAFVVGLANLFWFYQMENRQSVELSTHGATVAEESFGDIISTFAYCFWSLFGMGERNAAELIGYKQIDFTQLIGYLLYGTFMICCVIVLLNLFIAMMSLSFSQIQNAADTEWKFSRTQLFFDYMLPGSTLPVPLNLILTPKALFYGARSVYNWLSRRACRVRHSNKNEGEGTKTTEPTIDKPEGDLGPPNGPPKGGLIRRVTLPSLNPSQYTAVISRVVHRFVNEATTTNELDRDDENLKSEMLMIRREMTNALEMRAREIEVCRSSIMDTREFLGTDLLACKTQIDVLKDNTGTMSQKLSALDASISDVKQTMADNRPTLPSFISSEQPEVEITTEPVTSN